MRGKLKYLLFLLIAVAVCPTFNVKAQTYTAQFNDKYQWIPNTFINKTKGSNTKYQQLSIIARKSDNQFVYCIEPGTPLDSNETYVGQDYDQSYVANMTQAQWRRIQLLAYYGYGYSDSEVNHNDIKWYSVTQYLIWKTVPHGYDIYFTDSLNGNRITKYTNEIAEMEDLLNKHYATPDFGASSYQMAIGNTLKLTDKSGVLSKYEVSNNSYVSSSKSGNDLYITANVVGNTTLSLTKRDVKYSHPTIVYVKPGTQDIVQAGSYDPIDVNLNLNILGGRISITKKDSCGSVPNDASIEGAIYGIYDANGNKVTEITTDANGEATSGYLPSLGKFYVQEIKASNNYLLDSTRYEVVLTAENTAANVPIHIDVKENRKAKISLVKTDSKTGNRAQGDATLKGAVYDIFDVNGNRVGSMTTDENGRAISGYLPDVGTYTIKEVKPSKGYNLDPTIYTINVEEDKTCSYIPVESKETVITNTYEFTKLYAKADTGFMTPEVGATFAIYNSRDEKIAEFITDSDGKFKTTLPFGKYTLRQLTSTNNFNKVEDYHFEIKEQIDDTIYKNISNSEITAKLKVVKIDSETNEVIKRSGIKFKIFNIDKNEYVCQNITYPTSQKICVFETDKNGEFITPYELSSGRYRLEEVDQVIDGYLWNTNSHPFEIGENMEVITDSEYGIIFETLFSNTRVEGEFNLHKNGEKIVVSNGKMTFVKTDLKGIVFGIYAREDIIHNGKTVYHKGDLVTTIETDSNGDAKYSKMYLGKYFAKELKTLPNYKLDTNEYDFELKYKDQYTPVVKAMKEIDNFLITIDYDFMKTDMIDDKPIEGALIELYTEGGELIYSGYTDKEGKINFTIIDSEGNELKNKLPIGRYYVLEKEAPNNYLLNEDKIWLEVTATDTIVKSNMKDKRVEGTIKIHKDGEKYTISDLCEDPSKCFVYETDENLEGIKFGLYAREDIILNNIIRFKAGDLVAEGYTDEDGNLIFDNLYLGKYFVKELETKDKYVLDTKEYDFELEYVDSKTPIIETSFTLKNYLIKSDLEFTKTSISDGKPLPETLVEIYNENDELIFSGRTNEEGKIILKDIPVGKFYILEKEAPESYVVNDEPMWFEVKDNGEIIKANMEDEKIKSTVIIHKVDQDGNALAGVIIGIYDLDGNLIYEGTTDKDGNIELEMEYGKYYWQEISTIDGYVISDEKIYFDVSENGAIIEDTLVNIEVPNTLSNTYINLIGGLVILVGVGFILISNRNNKKKH